MEEGAIKGEIASVHESQNVALENFRQNTGSK